MNQFDTLALLCEWKEEIYNSSVQSNVFYIALFSVSGELKYINDSMNKLFISKSKNALINPSFDKLVSLGTDNCLIYSGIMTLGDYSSLNTSIQARIFRKKEEILIIGEIDAEELLRLNNITMNLNAEVNNLQRQLIKDNVLIEKRNEKLRELNATKDKLFSILAHDLRGPFQGFIGLSEELANSVADLQLDTASEYASVMNLTAKKLLDILNNLLDWARLQTGKMEFRPLKLHLWSEVAGIIDLYSSLAIAKSIIISNEIPEDIYINTDPNFLATILRNLLSNAIKFSNAGGIIVLKSEIRDGFTVVHISDNGIGMSEEIILKLFNYGTKFTNRGTSGEKGTGLGLAICKELLEKNGGQIQVMSSPNEGSTFSFMLPCSETVHN